MARKQHPAIIIGGGPAGAASALYLLRKGITPIIVERDSHPRYHVGESLTGATALALRDLGLGPPYRRPKLSDQAWSCLLRSGR